MFQTVEMRWFFDEPPMEAERHFHEHTELQERTDWYSMPCGELCGVKVREGKLEAKLRSETLGIRDLSPLIGQLEVYRKWSLEFSFGDHPDESDLAAVNWLPVDKQRNLRRFSVIDQVVRPSATRPENGCEFELTRLVVRGQTFWTVGFEAVGPRDRLEDNLRQVALYVASQGGLLQSYGAANSFGYAQWLSQFNRSSLPHPS